MKTKNRKNLILVITAVVFLASTNSVLAMYDTQTRRFTSRDPVTGKFKEPLSLHKYLYCLNDPVSKIDPKGEFASFANVLVANAMLGKLRKFDTYASMKFFRESKRTINVFNYIQLGKAVQAEMLITEFEGGLGRAGIDAVVGSLSSVFSQFFGTVEKAMVAKMGAYIAGDMAKGSLDFIRKDPSIDNFLDYLTRWGSRWESLGE